MLNSLYSRLSIALVILLVLVGLFVLGVARFATDNYYQEITQRLNAPIAMYVAQEHPLIENGVVNESAVAELAHQAMVINPTVEVYLLDAGGKVLTHGLPPEELQAVTVSMGPIHRFLSGEAEMPLRGDDPRNPETQKIFSVFPVGSTTAPEGYVYAVLGGEKYHAVADSIAQSYVLKVSLASIGAVIVFALLCGLSIFYALTRRLRLVNSQVMEFRRNQLGEEHVETAVSSDEIRSLDLSFQAMGQQILTQMERLRQTDAARRDLITNVSHDLRTPLSSMQGYIETLLIKDKQLTVTERQRYLTIARKHAVHLSRLVAELFELSKLDNLTLAPTPEPFSITELLQDIVQEFQLAAANKNVALVFDNNLENLIVQGDIGLIQRVLENLIENALRYTESGGSIEIMLKTDASNVNVTVQDSGCGIEQSKLKKIFDRFYRVEQSGPEKVGSAGLGLAIVKRILELHDSRITVDSKVDVGTSFSFDLPIPNRLAA